MFRRIAVVIALMALATTASTAAGDDPATPPPPPATKATVVSKTVKRPARVVHRRARFTPTMHPTPGYVRAVIIPLEAARAGVSAAALARRSYCESHWQWWATNGQYVGVLQFGANAFYRGLGSIGTRKIVLTDVKVRRMHSRVYRRWSDGHVSRHKGRIVRQLVVTQRVGYSTTRMLDPWTQIRIGAQALAGRSAVSSSEWSCGA